MKIADNTQVEQYFIFLYGINPPSPIYPIINTDNRTVIIRANAEYDAYRRTPVFSYIKHLNYDGYINWLRKNKINKITNNK